MALGGRGEITKNSTICLFPEGKGATEKKRKIAKKGRQIALLSPYLLYLYYV